MCIKFIRAIILLNTKDITILGYFNCAYTEIQIPSRNWMPNKESLWIFGSVHFHLAISKDESAHVHFGRLLLSHLCRALPWSSSSVLDHRSLPHMFESRHGYIWRLFHLWLRFITFKGHLGHLAYHVHKSGHKTLIIILVVCVTSLLSISQH